MPWEILLASSQPLKRRENPRTSARGSDEDHAHAIDGRLGASIGLAVLVLELVDAALKRTNVVLELLNDLFGRHGACDLGARLT